MNANDPGRPVVRTQNGRVFIDLAPLNADELQIHLRSLGIETAAEYVGSGESARLEVLDHGAEEVEAALGQWEVTRG